jgi:hypothetical protein
MPNGAKIDKNARTHAQVRRERLAAALRTNLGKRKQQARGRAAAAKADDEPGGDGKSGA